MSNTQNPPQTGRNCRLALAAFAGGRAAHQVLRKATCFSQSPPLALFAALVRAGKRRPLQQRLARGTDLAIR
jgi:hypothetical protein